MLKGINKIKIVIPTLITITLLLLLFLTLLATVDYSIEKVNWGDFLFSMFYSISGRMIYFPLGIEIGEQNEEVQLLENTISKYREEIYKTRTNKLITDKFKYKNTLNKATAYLNILDLQLNKLSFKQGKKAKEKCDYIMVEREQVIDFIDKFEKGTKYRGKFNLDNIRVKYDILDFGTCFSYGNQTRTVGHRYTINVSTEGAKKSTPYILWSAFMSFMSATMSILQYGFTWTALIMFIIKLLLFLMGCYNGLTIGREIIEKDKCNVLLNITADVKEVITEVENENGIIIDVTEENKLENKKLETAKG